MRRVLGLGASLFLLGACALPLPVQVAHWALDGLSYLATEKSVADHGLSLVAQKDCAILRGVLIDGRLCRDYEDDTGVAVASAGGRSDAIDVAAIADFETAAGGGTAVHDARPAGLKPLRRIHKPMMFEDGVALSGYPLVVEVGGPVAMPAKADVPRAKADAEAKAESEAAAESETLPAAVEVADSGQTATVAAAEPAWQAKATRIAAGAKEPTTGLYFVIGSFREHDNALKLRRQFQALMPAVLAATLDQGTVYRVVVGPFDHKDAKTVHQRIYRAGIVDSWAIRVNPGEWSMAMVDPPAAAPETADLNPEGLTAELLGYLKKLARWIY